MRDPDEALVPMPAIDRLVPPSDFVERAADLGVKLDAVAFERLGRYLARLLWMNERMNLTAVVDPRSAWEKHVLDSMTLVPLLADLPAGASVCDVGSGGGVPGIPLAIARPDLSFTLIDATQKKCAFLDAVAQELELRAVDVRAGRAEDLARGPLGASFDVVTARAVARLAKLVPWTAPFVRPSGRLLLVKGQRADEELAEAGKALRAARATHERTIATPTGRIVVLRID